MPGNGFLHSHSLPFPCNRFPFLPIPIPNFVTNSHSHGNPMGFPFPLGIPFPWSSLVVTCKLKQAHLFELKLIYDCICLSLETSRCNTTWRHANMHCLPPHCSRQQKFLSRCRDKKRWFVPRVCSRHLQCMLSSCTRSYVVTILPPSAVTQSSYFIRQVAVQVSTEVWTRPALPVITTVQRYSWVIGQLRNQSVRALIYTSDRTTCRLGENKPQL